MHDPLEITEADALALAEVAQVQLRLTKHFAERAEAAEDPDTACRLGRASERAARRFQQALLLKARLKRERDRDLRETAANPLPRTAQQQARVNQRVRQVYEAVEAAVDAELRAERLEDNPDDLLMAVLEHLEEDAKDGAFLADDLPTHIARICQLFELPIPDGPAPPAAPPDSS